MIIIYGEAVSHKLGFIYNISPKKVTVRMSNCLPCVLFTVEKTPAGSAEINMEFSLIYKLILVVYY